MNTLLLLLFYPESWLVNKHNTNVLYRKDRLMS